MRACATVHPTIIILTHASEELRANLLCEQGPALARIRITAERIFLDLSAECAADNEPNHLTFTLADALQRTTRTARKFHALHTSENYSYAFHNSSCAAQKV